MKKRFVSVLLSSAIFFLALLTLAKPVLADCVTDCIKNSGQDRLSCISDCKAAPEPAVWFDQNQKQYQDTLKDAAGLGKAGAEVGTGAVNQQGWVQSIFTSLANATGFSALGWLTPPTTGKATGPGGAVGFFANGIDTMVKTRPASSMEYVAYMGSQLHVPGTPSVAYAAGTTGGFGFNGLTPILTIWTVMRNFAYVIFAVVFIVIGVMIMTRQKIDPKTVATVQNALPKIVFALIFVTFSYPIAGLMIDLMYVLLGLVITIINAGFPGGGADVNKILSDGLFQYVIGGGLIVSAGSISQMVAGITNNLLGLQDVPIAGNIAGGISGGLAFVIVAIAILVALFRTWLALIGAFANIILQIIFAPLRLTLDAIPGQNQFGSWLKDLLANLLAFPLVAIFLAIGSGIAAQGPAMDPNLKGFVPPLIGAGNVREVLPFVGLGILLSIPKAIDILRELIKAPAFKYGSAWSEALGTATGVARGAASEYGPAKTYQLAKAGYEKEEGSRLANDGGIVARAARGFRPGIPNSANPTRTP